VTAPYNPLDMDNIASSIANALLETDPVRIGSLAGKHFLGAGIYAIYYVGTFPAYELIAKANLNDAWAQPIYVGKAIPEGGRKGKKDAEGGDPELITELVAPDRTRALSSRLREHASSISATTNLDIADFYCRWLVVERIWIPLGESLLINRYRPVWNRLVDGFGNHDPGKGRYAGMRTRWDVLHPGRVWSERLAPRTEVAQGIADDATEYLRQRLDP
jgi:hypothetical protein